MSIKNVLIDGYGSGYKAKIQKEGTLNVVMHPHPPISETVTSLPFRQFFTDNGRDTGSSDMIVDGSTNSQDFYIEAIPEYSIYIKTISIVIGDGGTPALNKFGSLNELTNGLEWIYSNRKLAEYVLDDAIKTNLEFIRIGISSAGFGTGVDAFLADVAGGGTEKSYLPVINLSETFGTPYGLKLEKGTTDKIIFRVRDNLGGLITFNAIGYGIRI